MMSFLFEDQKDFIPILLTLGGFQAQQTLEVITGILWRKQMDGYLRMTQDWT